MMATCSKSSTGLQRFLVATFKTGVQPIPAGAKDGTGIHHINFGLKLKERMDKLGVECTVRHQDEKANPLTETVEFFVKHLKP